MSDEEGSGVLSKLKDKFSPDLIARIQHASYLFFGIATCMILKGTNGQLVKMSGKLSVLQRGCEMLMEVEKKVYGDEGGGGGGDGGGGHSSSVLNVACYENTVVYRISFALAIFYFLHFLSVSDLTCCVDSDVRARMQTRFSFLKGGILLLLNFLTFFIPNAFFSYYAWLCMFAGAAFLLLQVVILVDWSYHWNDEWGQRAERNAKWQWYLLAVSVGSFVIGISMTIVNYVKFVPHQDCNLQGFLISLSLAAAVVYTLIAVWVPHGSIVPSGIVFAYTSIIGFTTLKLVGDPHCNAFASEDGSLEPSVKSMLITAVLSSVLLAYATVSIGGNRQSLTGITDEEMAEEDPDENGHLTGYCYFYLVMILGSMYLSMLVTDWQISGSDGSNGEAQGVSVVFWVKSSTIVLTIFLYLWTLLAPYYCCKDRDYGFDNTWE